MHSSICSNFIFNSPQWKQLKCLSTKNVYLDSNGIFRIPYNGLIPAIYKEQSTDTNTT